MRASPQIAFLVLFCGSACRPADEHRERGVMSASAGPAMSVPPAPAAPLALCFDAQCDDATASRLRALYPTHSHCPKDVGIDPCFIRASIECFCDEYSNLLRRCPLQTCR